MLYNNGESEVNTLFLWNKKEDDTDYRIKFVRWLIITSVATLICLVLQLCHIMYFPWLFVFSPTILFVFWYAGVSLRYGLEHFENINIWMNGDSIFVILTIVFFILRLTNVITWSWIWVFSPLWIGFALIGVIFVILCFISWWRGL